MWAAAVQPMLAFASTPFGVTQALHRQPPASPPASPPPGPSPHFGGGLSKRGGRGGGRRANAGTTHWVSGVGSSGAFPERSLRLAGRAPYTTKSKRASSRGPEYQQRARRGCGLPLAPHPDAGGADDGGLALHPQVLDDAARNAGVGLRAAGDGQATRD